MTDNNFWNQKRLVASEIIRELYSAKEVGQLELLKIACEVSLKKIEEGYDPFDEKHLESNGQCEWCESKIQDLHTRYGFEFCSKNCVTKWTEWNNVYTE